MQDLGYTKKLKNALLASFAPDCKITNNLQVNLH